MKNIARKIIQSSLLLVSLLTTPKAMAQTTTVTLAWNYPAPVDPNLVFIIWETTNVAAPFAQWTQLTNFPATNECGTNLVANQNFVQHLAMVPGAYYFVAQSSNSFWNMVSLTSNVTWTPPAPLPFTNLNISRP